MSWGLSKRKLERYAALEKRRTNLRLPLIFDAFEEGQAFFWKDRLFVKTSFTIAREVGAITDTHFSEFEEIQW